jgi:formylglycine-generating enzyme required for sulfatase activity
MNLILPVLLALFSAIFLQDVASQKTIVLPGNIPLEFVYIKPGKFLRGSAAEEINRDADEGPQHSVVISKGFYLGVHEVTQRQWSAMMGLNPSMFQQKSDEEDTLNRPVDSVSWEDTQQFLQRINALGVGKFRLPTEAEWEYAARGGTNTPFSLETDVHQFAWANSRSQARTHPVGGKSPNPWGLFDIHGNVWEWCHDWYGPYDAESKVDPTGPRDGNEKVFRGGSWYDFPFVSRSANRHRHPPNKKYTAIGFRLLLEVQGIEEHVVLLPGNIGMRFSKIPAGEYVMGSPTTETGRANDEGPPRRLIISKPFAIGVHEVTQAQWKAVMGNNPSVFQDDDSNPVEMVSWNDAQQFVERINALNIGGTFRLPTEAEWEYAARAGTTTRYSFGDDHNYRELMDYAWYYSLAEGRSHAVGLKKPNPWGLFDMHGGVWEWCGDWFATLPPVEVDKDPIGPKIGESRVIRGGSWFNEPEALRSANRHRHHPDSRQTNIGLRLVWLAP